MNRNELKTIVLLVLLLVAVTIGLLCMPVSAETVPEVVTVIKTVEKPVIAVREIEVVKEVPSETIIEDDGIYTITAYCSCEKCCGKWYQGEGVEVIGSGGVALHEGEHCASPLPNGTKIIIEGVGLREVQDTPAKWISEKYSGKIIDLYFSDHETALKFGKKKANVKIIKEVIAQ